MEKFIGEAASSPSPIPFFLLFSIWSARLNRVPVGGPWGRWARGFLLPSGLLLAVIP